MKMNCPNCNSLINWNSLTCNKGHKFEEKDGVKIILEKDFKTKLTSFLRDYQEFQKNINPVSPIPVSKYPSLPYIKGKHTKTWKLRVKDLEIINQLIGNEKGLKILELGSYNGWLSNRLTLLGHQVTALSYFIDEQNGLLSKKHYTNDWESIQMNTEKIELIKTNFDVIILNRCISFFSDPLNYIEKLKELLKPKGKLIITGIYIYQRTKKIENHYKNINAMFRSKYNYDLFFTNTNKYLNLNDKNTLVNGQIRLNRYSDFYSIWLKKIIGKIDYDHYWGIFEN